jgi:hypothetical protein
MAFLAYKITMQADVNADNLVVGDLYIDSLGNLVEIHNDSDDNISRAALQGIWSRLKLVKGDYFLNLYEGIPYYTDVFVKNPSVPLIKSIFKQAILSYPGITEVSNMILDWNRSTRQATISFTAVLNSGLILKSSDFGPMIIDLSLKQDIRRS